MKAQQPNTEWTVYEDGLGLSRYRRRYPNDDRANVDPYPVSTDDGGHRVELWSYRYERWHGVVFNGWTATSGQARVLCDELQHVFATGERTPPATAEGEHYQHTAADYQ